VLTSRDFWRDRPVLVTGATGLLGSWIVKALRELGADTVCLVRDWVPQSELVRTHVLEQIKVVRGDIRDQGTLERVLNEFEVVTVLHLAAQTIVGVANRNPVSTFETNVTGTWALLEACRRCPTVKQIVLASSDKAYGDQTNLPYTEATPLRGRNIYDVSKSCADLLAQSYAHVFGLPVAITRCGNFYGGGDLNWNRIVPGTIRSILRHARPVIRSDGSFVRDYIYVEDAVGAYLFLAEHLERTPSLRGEAFNFSNEVQITVLELVQKISAMMGSTLAPEVLNQANNEISHQYLNAEKARRILGWSPEYTLDTGLAKTIAWYREVFAENA
jgi:CDP-glucose 4,6-dehydratase